MTAIPNITLRQAAFTYPNGVVALAPMDCDIRAGEFVSILGPSGCGKSTLLRLIAGLLPASSGTITLKEMSNQPSSDIASGAKQSIFRFQSVLSGLPRRFAPRNDGLVQRILNDGVGDRTGFVFQNPTLMPWTDVDGNVRLPHHLHGSAARDADARVDHALHMVGLQEFRHAWPRELSGGMQMRVSIARSLAMQPQLLLMDEPFAALDEITRHKLNADLRALWHAEALTILFVTHSIYEAVFLSTRIVVMSARPGRIVGELAIDAAQPRDEAFRTSADYVHYCAEASRLLRMGMEPAAT